MTVVYDTVRTPGGGVAAAARVEVTIAAPGVGADGASTVTWQQSIKTDVAGYWKADFEPRTDGNFYQASYPDGSVWSFNPPSSGPVALVSCLVIPTEAAPEWGTAVPAGGNSGDALVKRSGTAGDVGWTAVMRQVWVSPEQFNTGTDDGNWAAALAYGGVVGAAHVVIVGTYGKTYTWNTTQAWDSVNGSLTVLMHGATISSTVAGSAITCLTHTGGNTPPRMRWVSGTYSSSAGAKFFDCTDVRASSWEGCTFAVTNGIAVSLLNVNSFCENNKIFDCRDQGCRQVAVLERGFKSTTQAVTFTTGTNAVTQTAHGFGSGDWCKFATVGSSGLVGGQVYYVSVIIDADHYTLNSQQCDAFGNFDPAFNVTFPNTSTGSAFNLASSSFARTGIERLFVTGGTYGYGKVEFNNCGPYDSRIGPFTGNLPNGVGCVDFLNSRSQGNSILGPMLVEASDDGKSITGSAATNIITVSAAPASRPLAVGQAVQLTKLTGGSGIVAEQTYFINTLPTALTFTVSATPGGATLPLGTDITAGFFWNTRPWKYRWGQSAGQAPTMDEPLTLRNLALYDPASFNAGTYTVSTPDGSLAVWQKRQLSGATITNSKQNFGVDMAGAQPVPSAPINPVLYLSDGSTIDTSGAFIVQPAHGKGLYLLDQAGAVLLGVSHLGAITGSALTAVAQPAGTVLTEAAIDYTTTKPDITTTSLTAHDITADVLALGTPWAGVVASSLDCAFVAPSSGIVRVEIDALVKLSSTGSPIQFSLSDVTSTPTAVSNSLLNIFQSASTTNMRVRYSRKFTVTAGQTYVWRPQWNSSGVLTSTISCGAQFGPVRMSVFAWK